MNRIALCPGTYDPITEGHKDIIKRCSKIFDFVIVLVSNNPRKEPLYSLERRLDFVRRSLIKLSNVKVTFSDGLLVNIAKEKNAQIIIKGLRAITDFEYEFQMAQMNKKLAPDIETFFIVSNPKYAYLSSSAVKEVASLNGCIKGLVPEEIEDDIVESFRLKQFS